MKSLEKKYTYNTGGNIIMIKTKTIAERMQDICNRSGLSMEIVQRVMIARADSILDDLKNGLRVVDYGVSSMTPYTTNKLCVGGMGKYVGVKCEVSPRIIDALNSVENYTIDESDDDNGNVRVQTLPAFM